MSGVSAFLWQAALMLLVAYFLGAWFGCMLRRLFARPPKIAMETEAARAAAAAAAGGGATATAARFGSALDGDAVSQGTTAAPAPRAAAPPPQPAAPPPQPAAAPAPRPAPTADPSPAEPSVAGTAPGPVAPPAPPVDAAPVEAAPATAQAEPAPQPGAEFTPPMSAAEAAAKARAARGQAVRQQEEHSAAKTDEAPGNRPQPTSVAARMQTLETIPPKPEPEPQDAASRSDGPDLPSSAGTGGQAVVAAKIADRAVAAEGASAPATTPEASAVAPDDDLTMIAGITPADADLLRQAGVTTFAAIAGWTASDVRRFNDAVGGDRRISRENWIEQAELLRQNGATGFTRRGRLSLAPRPAEVRSPETVPTASAPAADTEAAPAGTTSPPKAPPADTVGAHQAASNAAAAAAAAVTAATVAANVAAEPEAAPASKPVVSERAAFAAGAGKYREDLQQIDGINAEVEQLLYDQGVTRIAQIADWSAPEQRRIDLLLGGMNRVKRENWVGQARRICGYPDETADEAAPAGTGAPVQAPDNAEENRAAAAAVAATLMNGDGAAEIAVADGAEQDKVGSDSDVPRIPEARSVRGLRSVRSEALVGASGIDTTAEGDDLKRIRGIGVLIEKRLRAMGYASYEQVASWTQSDIDRVNQQLDFRGRIERENWIEQARILASGGQTEFSRRRDSGDE